MPVMLSKIENFKHLVRLKKKSHLLVDKVTQDVHVSVSTRVRSEYVVVRNNHNAFPVPNLLRNNGWERNDVSQKFKDHVCIVI